MHKWIYIHIHTYIHARIHTWTCLYVNMDTDMFMHTYLLTTDSNQDPGPRLLCSQAGGQDPKLHPNRGGRGACHEEGRLRRLGVASNMYVYVYTYMYPYVSTFMYIMYDMYICIYIYTATQRYIHTYRDTRISVGSTLEWWTRPTCLTFSSRLSLFKYFPRSPSEPPLAQVMAHMKKAKSEL